MPFVNIRLVEGRSQQRKDEISKRVTAAISEVLQLPKDDIWVVFEDVPAGETYLMGVASKRYRFATRVVQVFDTLTDVEFTGIE